jgi:ABC-type nitrate/sulfonate/bicarbonate transport system substrate-binding protein
MIQLDKDIEQSLEVSRAWQRGYNEAMQYMDENPSVLRAILAKVEKREAEERKIKAASVGRESRYAQTNRRV